MQNQLPPIITLEDHFLSRDASSSLLERYQKLSTMMSIPSTEASLVDKLQDVGPLRLQAMDSGDASLQIVSHTPGLSIAPTEHCRKANDQLHDAVRAEETRAGGADGLRRYAGFAVLPMNDPKAAAEELHRCVKTLDFVGALIDNHADGIFYDSSAYDVFWAAAERLKAPVYLHPTWPEQAIIDARFTGELLSKPAQMTLASSGWGWHSDTAIHVLRLYAAGVFDRFPSVQVIIGHMGEMIPFQLDRVIRASRAWGEKRRSFKAMWDENIWLTTSGNWSIDPMACLLRNTRKERIMFSVDYPFQSFEASKQFLYDLKDSGLVDEQAFENICYRNAEQLLGVHAPKRSKS